MTDTGYIGGMPSYRVVLTIGALRAGTRPDAVLPAAVEAAGTVTTVEASDVAVVAGVAHITVRFTEDFDDAATQLGAQAAEHVADFADVSAHAVTKRVKGRWIPVAPHEVGQC